MKTIKVQAVDPNDGKIRENEIVVSRIVGWYQRDKGFTRISLDFYVQTEFGWMNGEYQIAESSESFSTRLAAITERGIKCEK